MKSENKKIYWKGIEQLTNDPSFIKNADKEFSENLPIKDAYGDNTQGLSSNRRDFLKLMGFSVAAVSLAACETPVRKAIPYLNKPETVDPGVPNYYASTFMDGSDYCPVVVKTREGRPIFIEGNAMSSISQGGTNPRVQASVMSLYDIEKAQNASKSGSKIDWATADSEIVAALKAASSSGKTIALVSNSIVSPSTKKLIGEFAAKYPGTKHVSYDLESSYAIAAAYKGLSGKAVIPSFNFAAAEVIVSFGADFLSGWLSSVEFSKQYAQTRKVSKKKKTMSAHYQVESNFTMTGANADYRTAIRPSQEGLAVAALYNELAKKMGKQTISVSYSFKNLDKIVAALSEAQGKSLVVSGSNDVAIQFLVASINDMLGNHSTTVNPAQPTFVRQGDDVAMSGLVAEIANAGVVIFVNSNPVYDHPQGDKIAEALNGKVSVSTADRLDETASLCTYNCPDSHFLESWGDAEPKRGFFSLAQPTISRIFDTRQVQQSLLAWSESTVVYEDYLKNYWKESVFTLQTKETDFTKFWVRSLHDGVVELQAPEGYVSIHEGTSFPSLSAESALMDASMAASKIASKYKDGNTGFELVVYSSGILGSGKQANNPMLQETPDPISKMCWGNYLAVAPTTASRLGFSAFETEVSVGSLVVGGKEVKLPVIIQPGLLDNVVAVAFGYGRSKAGKVANEAAGQSATSFLVVDTTVQNTRFEGVDVKATGEKTMVAQTQTHNTIMGRETIIQETTLSEYKENPQAGRFKPMISTYSEMTKPQDISMWDINSDGYKNGGEEKKGKGGLLLWNEKLGIKADTHAYTSHHWGLAIDLNSCTGCSACVVACHIENNVPVVGKIEVARRREMHWMRIDRYYSNPAGIDEKGLGIIDRYRAMEESADMPEVVFQPMMCQHCNNAPCETVCPVAATTHSTEGLNQMTYNRCVGTKYCANNCPYKVRRFNWFKYHDNKEFDYHANNMLGKMVLNPDVTVRSRGVMEKCSMCVQRIQAGKLKAKVENRKVKDGEVTTACASACPSNAIMFGDLNDSDSAIRQLMDEELYGRAYNVLEEVNTRPNVWYLTKVRNKTSESNS